MAEKFTRLNPEMSFDALMLKKDYLQKRIMAIANGNINCDYAMAIKTLDAYEKMVAQTNDGYLFLAWAKGSLNEHYAKTKSDVGTSL